MRCIICDKSTWENVNKFRSHEPKFDGKKTYMAICKSCGFVGYPEITEKGLDEYYRKEYRKPPTISNMFTGQRKLHYHRKFLGDYIRENREKEIDVFEIGCAFGMFLSWFKENCPKATVSGTEMTLSYRRIAWHDFGIKLSEKMPKDKKYDLICSYKVLEHQFDADKRLSEYKAALKPGGLIYISVPIWFEALKCFGVAGSNLDEYYHPNHINVWSIDHFNSLLRKVGLEVIKEDHVMYNTTYLCKPCKPKFEPPKLYKDTLDKLDRIKKASIAFEKHDFGEAIKHWPNYQDAWAGHTEMNRKGHHKGGIDLIKEKFLDPMLKATNNDPETLCFVADYHMRYERYNEAVSYAEKSLNIKPNSGPLLDILANCRSGNNAPS